MASAIVLPITLQQNEDPSEGESGRKKAIVAQMGVGRAIVYQGNFDKITAIRKWVS